MRRIKIKAFIAVALLFILGTASQAAVDSKGTNFVIGFPPNYTTSGSITLHISSSEGAQGTVEIPSLSFVQSFTVPANDIISIQLPNTIQSMTSGTVSNRSVRIVTDNEVTVNALNRIQYSTDAYMALPVDALGLEYVVMSHRGVAGFPSQVLVVAPYDNTQITITPSVTAGGTPGTPFTVTLNSGETYYLANSSFDLTGTIVTSSSPVGVLGGAACANVPVSYAWCDHVIEMMPAVSTWGESFLTVPLATRTRGDFFRVLASSDNTIVTIDGVDVATINRGQIYEGFITTRSHITTNAPALVAQFSVGQSYDGVISDPFMMIVPPSEQFLSDYVFTTLSSADGFPVSYVNVVARTDEINSIVIDGTSIDQTLFLPIGTTGYSGAQVQATPGTHRINSLTPFGIYVYGFGSFDSYGYPGGMAFDLINPIGDTYAPNVLLTQLADQIQGIAEDSEDLNINGVLDAGEDINGNGVLDRRTEDTNANGLLDVGEDTNGNGVLDRDTGIFRVEIEAGSTNLQVVLDNFIPGATRALFTVSRIDPTLPGQGVLVVLDGTGNRVTRDIDLGGQAVLSNVRLMSTLSSDRIDVDAASFSVAPYSTNVINGQTVIEWRFNAFNIGQIQDISFDVFLRNPIPGESKLVTQNLDLYYTDINGNEAHSGLGSKVVEVLTSTHTVAISTDRSQYTVNENVLINASVSNLSTFDSTTTARVRIKDGTGALVSELGTFPNTAIAASSSVAIPVGPFNTGSYYAGMYSAQIELLDAHNNVYAQASASFIIGTPSDIRVSATVSTDKPIYSPFETVNVLDRIRNVVANASLDNMSATTTVLDPDGMTLWSQTAALPQILPNNLRDLNYSVPLGRALAGTYRVILVVKDDQGIERALSEKTFIVQSTADTGAGLIGSIDTTPNTVLKSEYLSIEAKLNNQGNVNLASLPVTISIIDPANAQVIQQWTQTLSSLAIQSEQTVSQTWQSVGPIGAAYVAVLTADIGGQTKTLAQKTFYIGQKFGTQISLDGKARLLVLLSDGAQYEEDDDDKGKKPDPDYFAQRQAYLTTLLEQAGWKQFTIVTDRDRFLTELRTGTYQAYALLGKKDELYDQIEDELTEAVHRGEGLVVANGKHDPDDALGIEDRQGGLASSLTLYASDYHPGGVLNFHAMLKVDPVQTEGATALAEFADIASYPAQSKSNIAITQFAFGQGKSMYVGFDLLEEAYLAPGGAFEELLASALAAVHPSVVSTYTGGIVPVTIQVTNNGTASEGQLTIHLGGLTLVDANGGTVEPDNSVTLPFTMNAQQVLSHTLWIQLPAAATSVVISAQMQSGTSPNFIDHDTVQMQLNVLPAPVLSDIQAQVSLLESADSHYKKVSTYLTQANTALAKGNMLQALNKLLEAAEELGEVPTDEAKQLRIGIDYIIRDLEMQL